MATLTDKQILDKISAARTRLILDKPFLGALVLRLPVEEADPAWCRTVATDARKFYYNRDYISELRPHEMQFMLAHEALHCGLLHFARRQNRVRQRWDLACDYAINPLLLADGLTPPPDAMVMREFEGMTAEEIYPCIDENDNSETLDQHLYDEDDGQSEKGDGEAGRRRESRMKEQSAGEGQSKTGPGGGVGQTTGAENDAGQGGLAGKPAPLSEQEKQQLAVQWQQRLAGAAQQAMQAGKLGGEMARMVDLMLQPQLPWRMLLARYISQRAREDYSYTRPSSRRGDPAVFPSLRSSELNVAVALDTSGSVTDQEIAEFVAEVDAVKGYLRARITLLLCDAALSSNGPQVFEYWEDFSVPAELSGGGGTDFRPVFDFLDQQDMPPDVLLYFTDGKGAFPPSPPAWPTLWLVKGSADVPFGQRIQLN
ncbi:MAG: hypothetical protein KDJ38_02570 [Gammaproteobacteria bacterium]|nr:hypothetical protein [Gammaproteobacteria bacterium]